MFSFEMLYAFVMFISCLYLLKCVYILCIVLTFNFSYFFLFVLTNKLCPLWIKASAK